MSRPQLEVADIIRSAGAASRATVTGSAGPTSRSCWPSRAVAPPLSAVISMSAPAADIVPSPTTRVAIGTAPSVRPVRVNAGSRRVVVNFCPRLTSTSFSLCRRNWRRWLSRTGNSSTVCCSGPALKLCWRLRATPPISEPRSASSACSIPGTRNSNFIPMSTVSFPPADSPAITPAGFDPIPASSFPSLYCGACFAASSSPALKSAFEHRQLHLAGELAPLTHPKFFAAWLRPLFRKDWIVYSKPPFGGPEYVLQYFGRYTHRVAISNHRLVALADGQVTFRWRDSADHNRQKVMTVSRDEFLRRFLLHLLPKGFVRIRHFGFLANRRRAALLPRCFAALHTTPSKNESETSTATTSHPLWRCPKCGGPMAVVERFTAAQLQLRSPPLLATAA